MNVGKQGKVDGIGYGMCLGKFTFFPNGTSNPTNITGELARFVSSITYSATGVQTVVFTSEFGVAQTPQFFMAPACASVATSYEVSQVGAYNATTRTLVLQQRQGQTQYAVAASASAFVT